MRGSIFSKVRIGLAFCAGVFAIEVLTACGGGSDGTVSDVSPDGSASADLAPQPAQSGVDTSSVERVSALFTPVTNSCASLPPMPVKPASGTRNVRDFGATPDDSTDDTDAIQRALDSLSPGQWLIFPAGRYKHSKSLKVRVSNVVLWSEGAALHATNPADQAIWISADGASVYGFTLTAVTNGRRTTPWESRIAVFGGSNPRKLLHNNIVRGNKVVWGGDPGTPLANSASSAGIFVYYATGFLIAENKVSRSLSDGIHITAGSYNGRVIKNEVRENGDDMIAMVSYINGSTLSPSEVKSVYDARRAIDLVHDILVARNTVSGQYWGRGISVVGGEAVTIENNLISRTTHGAGVYLAREPGYLTFGVRNVIVRNNDISQVQTTAPNYAPAGTTYYETYHGGVEIYSQVFTDEAADAFLLDKLAVQQILMENNTINQVKRTAMRIGIGYGSTYNMTARRADGSTYTRSVTGGNTGLLHLNYNVMSNAPSGAISIRNRPTSSYNVRCDGNTYNGSATTSSLCSGAVPSIKGATVTCG
jgi:parallel beta-helix repeat protein